MQDVFKYAMRHVDDWSVVRLEDGRVGYKGGHTGPKLAIVIFADKSRVALKPDTIVEVLRYPAQLASEYVKMLEHANQRGWWLPGP